MDYLIQKTDPNYVGFELDILWTFFPGADPAALINKYPTRFKLMHLKDLRKGVEGNLSGGTPVQNDVALGTGQLDIPGILKAAQKSDIQHYYIEPGRRSGRKSKLRHPSAANDGVFEEFEEVKWSSRRDAKPQRDPAPLREFKCTEMMKQALFFAFILCANAVFARNYFVNSLSGNDANAGTDRKSPWKTLAKVNAMSFQPGDSVFFERGSSWAENLQIKNSGAPGNPLVFCAIGKGEKPVVSFAGNRTKAIDITGSWVVLDGFFAKDANLSGIYIAKGADYNVIRNCEIANCGGGVTMYGRHNLITHNYAHDLVMVKNTQAESRTAPGGDDDYGAVAYWVFNSNNEIAYNRAERCRASSYDYGADGGFFEVYTNGDSTYVHHNYAEDCNGFLEIGGGKARNITVSHNVSVENGEWTFHLGGKFAADIQDFRMEHNTIISRKGTKWNNILGFSKGAIDAKMLIFKNNIVVLGGEAAEKVSKNNNFIHEGNTYFLLDGAQLGFPAGPNEQVTVSH